MILLVISFIAGVLTALAPCILPLLPVIVGGSLEAAGNVGSRRRMYTIVASLGISVILFTLILKVSTALIGIPPYVWTWVSGGIVGLFGLTLLFPELWERLPFVARLSIGSNKLLGLGNQKKSFTGDVLMGAALGPVFSTCSPTYFVVLATVLPENFALGMVYLFAYTVGLCLMLLLVGYIGQRLADGLGFAADPRGVFKRGLGLLFLVVAFFIVSEQDKQLQIKILDAGFFDVTKIEQWLLRMTEPEKPITEKTVEKLEVLDEAMRIAKKERLYQRAPEIMKPAGYVNTDGKPITIGEFKGKKVILLDIWTYSCINCQRTIPYLNAWHEKYAGQGLQIIGIHTPEFAFEKDIENVEWAVQQFKIKYPSILDNEYATWKELGNNYWPRKYLVDIDGFIIYDHIGEGSYEETEAAIQRALMERAMVVGEDRQGDEEVVAASIRSTDTSGVASPEIYFGAWRNERLGNGVPGDEGERTYEAPQNISRNLVYLEGGWRTTREYTESRSPGKIIFKYSSKDVYMVASADKPVRMRVLRDGKPVGAFAGADVGSDGFVTVEVNRLYKLIHDQTPGEHLLELEIEGAGLKAYTFTFG